MGEDYLNLYIGIAGLLISILGLVQALISSHFERWMKRFFLNFFGIMVGIAVFNLIGQYVSLQPDLIHARIFRFTLFCESFLPSLLMLLLTVFLLLSSGEMDWKRSRLFHIVMALWIIYVALLIYVQFSTVIYSIDDNNVYRRGPLYPLLLAPPALIMAIDAIALWRRRHHLSAKQRLAFDIYIIVPLISMLIQMFFYGIYTILLGSSLAALFMFNYIWIDQSERYYQQVEENKQLRIEIMLSQIQPHFLSVAAEKAVSTFSRYLRGNMDSLFNDKAIPFEQELRHTKLYLELEQLRYEDALQVSYDLQCTEFNIPTLTLQPLVENAVRHGVRGKLSGRGSVQIATNECPDRYEVSVSDDGPGFDPSKKVQNGHSHIGLANVSERLQRVVGGSLSIHSAPGAGTTVVITIPKEPEGVG